MISCPACGAENPDRSKFCNECAASLATPLPVPEERKTVTTLFCDLVAFTAMSEAADPEDVDALLGEYFARATKVIESHGGTVEKFIGDAAVGVFGVPAVHEDDPERAVRAGLRILEALEGMTCPDGSPLQARVGVNTGEALVRLDVDPASGRGFLTGDAVNTAARLEAAAPPGGVAVGALTHELTERVIEYEELPDVTAKGKAEPVLAWCAIAPVARRGGDTDAADLTPFIGRGGELSYLTTLLEDTQASGLPRTVVISGEPGIGKTRLVRELYAYADDLPGLVTWRQGRCLAYGEGVAYSALSEIVRGHAGILESDDVETREAKLDGVLPQGDDREWLRQRLRALVGLDAAQAGRNESFAAWTSFLGAVAGTGPAVVVFEDLHWADDALLDFLDHLAGHAAEVPLLVVATTRPELFESHPAFGTDARANRLSLEPLSGAETQALVTSLLGDNDGGLAARIVERAGGNPFFAEESTRLYRERRGRAAEDVRETLLTGSVQAVIAARLDMLPPDHKALLAEASVVGQVFWAGALIAVGERVADEVGDALDALAAKQLVRRRRESSLAGEREYAFAHALVRDVAYAQLPRAVRADRHAATAVWLQSRAGGRLRDVAEVVAGHFEAALALTSALGDGAGAAQLREQAVASHALAAQRWRGIDRGTCKRHCERALELADADSPERPRLLAYWAEVLDGENRYREATEVIEEAIPLLLNVGDAGAAAVAMCELAIIRLIRGEPTGDLLDEALALVDRDEPSPELAEVLVACMGIAFMERGTPMTDVIELADRAVAVRRELGLPLPAKAISFRAAARLELGDPGGLEDYELAIAEARAQGLGSDLVLILFNQTSEIYAAAGPVAASAAETEGLDLARRRGLADFVLASRALLVESLGAMGNWPAALHAAQELGPETERFEDTWDLLYVRSLEAMLLGRMGRVREVEPWLRWLIATGRESEVAWLTTYALLAAAEVELLRGGTAAALDILEEWAALPPTSGEPKHVGLVPAAVRTALAAGDAALAGRIAARPESVHAIGEHARTSVDACLLEFRGEHEASAVGFADAATRWHDFGVPYEEAQALLGQGRCLVALGRAPEAAAPLAAAREIFARLGAKPALAETDALLQQVPPA